MLFRQMHTRNKWINVHLPWFETLVLHVLLHEYKTNYTSFNLVSALLTLLYISIYLHSKEMQVLARLKKRSIIIIRLCFVFLHSFNATFLLSWHSEHLFSCFQLTANTKNISLRCEILNHVGLLLIHFQNCKRW